MPTYKIYDLAWNGHIKGPPEVVSGQDDSDAILAAEKRRNGGDQEVWLGTRLVAVIKSKHDK